MRALITGGAGFIGIQTADRLLSMGEEVVLLDNLSRRGGRQNLAWLKERHPDIPFEEADVRDFASMTSIVGRYQPLDVVFHFAAQVAVTSSVQRPKEDFDINALGTLNVLESIRQIDADPIFIYSSTNKVYGEMEEVEVVEDETRYRYASLPYGIPETAPLDFHSPYGCSKGAADQYVRDYHRIYGMRTMVFRNSCIYGPRQFGIEDQGWVAWFIIAWLQKHPLTIYGDGKQVRDLLYIDDLIDGMLRAIEQIDQTQGQIYNMGGGADYSLSIWKECGPMLEELAGEPIPITRGDWRPGDQMVYISDIRKAAQHFDWRPSVDPREGIAKLFTWASENAHLFSE
ncbi:MAG: SDR family NAD(P)-dependent oxidoreductase [Anaerolineales bacterium]